MSATAIRPRIEYPRPQVTVLYAELFREPVYEDGEPYGQDDDEDDEV